MWTKDQATESVRRAHQLLASLGATDITQKTFQQYGGKAYINVRGTVNQLPTNKDCREVGFRHNQWRVEGGGTCSYCTNGEHPTVLSLNTGNFLC